MNQEREVTGPGIVVLSSSLEILHMNRRAMALLRQLEGTARHIEAAQALPTSLQQHCRDIVEALQEHLASNNWKHFHQYRMIGNSTYPILLKGFGLPDSRGLSHSRIVLLLSRHIPAPLSPIATAAAHN